MLVFILQARSKAEITGGAEHIFLIKPPSPTPYPRQKYRR